MRMRDSTALAITAAVFGALLAGTAGPEAQAPAQQTPAKQAPKPPPAKGKLTPAEEKARENYRKVCEPCHGAEGNAAPLPNMTKLSEGQWKHGTSLDQIAKTIAEGVPGTVMMPNKDKFTEAEIRELAKLVRSFHPKFKTAK